MEDAYVIGIRLALEDGISAGLAAIQGELATLDIAIAATTAHLAQLHAVAALPDLRPRATPPELVAQPSPQPTPAGSQNQVTRSADPAVPAAAQPPTSAPLPFGRALPLQSAPPPAPVPAAPKPMLTPVRDSVVPLAASTSPAAAPRPLSSPLPLREGPGEGSRRVDPVQAAQAVSAAPVVPVVASIPAPATVTSSRAPRAWTLDGLAHHGLTQGHGSAATTRGPSTASHRASHTGAGLTRLRPPDAGPRGDSGCSGAFARCAPIQQTAFAPPAPSPMPRPAAPYAPPPPPPAAHVAAETAVQPTGGPVYLDGHYVGRWVSDHLAREASRPSATTAAFDPRLTPAYPGALQGN